MKKILMLSFSNIKKAKANSISLSIMFIISALLLNVGILVLFNFGNFFDKTVKELNTTDTYYLISKNLYSEELEDYILNHENIENIQMEDNLWARGVTIVNGTNIGLTYTFNNADIQRDYSKYKLIGDSLPLNYMDVYLPITYHYLYGYELQDEFNLTVDQSIFNFKIAGFSEDIFFTTQETGLPSIYVNSETYSYLVDTLGEDAQVIKIYANLKEYNKAVEIGIKEQTGAESLSTATKFTNGMFSLDLIIIKTARTMMANLVSLIFVIFSILIVIACLLVVRFRIINTIEDDMKKIGTLKALGYTSKQIILSIIVQFTLIASLGSLIGITLSYLTIPALSNMFASQSGLVWKQSFDLRISFFTLMFINLFVIIISLFTSRRIHKLHPIIALRGGLVNHNFRKSHFPLSKTKLPLSINLAFKSIINNLKQSFMILIITLAIAFAGAFAVIMFYNTNIDITAFKETPGVEMANVVAYLDSQVSNDEFINELSKLEEVRKVQFIDGNAVIIDGLEIAVFVMDDFKSKETNTIYEGRYPNHHNEIAINGYLAQIINKEIGDIIDISYGENSEEYIITGLTQGAVMMGMNGFMRLDGVKKINPSFKQTTLQIYLKDGIDTDNFIEKLESDYFGKASGYQNVDKSMEDGSKTYVDIVSQVGISILIITTIIIVLILNLIINSTIVRNKRNIGIQKSIGFSTFQLMNQLSLLFVFPIIFGVVTGAIIGTNFTNPILSVFQRSMGIVKTNYIITPLWISLYAILIIIFSYFTSLILTYKIRKISASSLITE